ncbi:39S ribosomal protein l53, mitochondrial-like [Plakobranchus ocellatus]|uniref:Large ribosomal subunit protein mL53 n=1 Tax=Plakobranchus ocellatus TaxID=259542 RepID=A0AAV4ARX1_9GAST|nr:39S ribosomal protein l53, mitochondrial-like [Plakobranchus ocellatus]
MAFALRKATTYLVKRMHLRPVRKVQFTFDPYMKNVTSIRDVASTLHKPEILETNQGTILKFDIKSDRTEPRIDVHFNDGEKLVFKTGNLSQLEILDYLYEYVQEKDPRKNESPELVTKSAKAGTKGGKGKKKR